MKRIWKVGLEQLDRLVGRTLKAGADGYPPFNIEQQGEDAYRVTLAVAGFAAGDLGVTVEEFQAAVMQTQLQLVDEALANGDITEEQAAERRARIEAGEPGFFPGRPHQRPQHRAYGVMMEVAEFIGVTPEELKAGLESGQSVAQVAEANGVTAEALAEYLLGEVQTHVAQALEDGKIDQAKADEILANAPARIEEMINRQGLPDRRHGGHTGAGFRPGGFRDGSAPKLESAGVSPTF